MSEYHLHVATADLLKICMPANVPYWHTHQSGYLSIAERVKAKRMGRRSGVPDWTFLLPPTARAAFIELKTDGGALSASQKDFRNWAIGVGALYAVCRSVEEVQGTLKGWGVLA
jgi:hypothetical protein